MRSFFCYFCVCGFSMMFASSPAYILNTDSIWPMNLSNLSVDNNIQNGIGPNPHGIAVGQQGKVAYVLRNDPLGTPQSFLVRLDIEDPNSSTYGTTIGDSIGLGNGNDGEIVITPDNAYAYVSNSDSASVSVISLKTNQVVDIITTVGTSPRALAITPDGKYVYVANYGIWNSSGTVSVIDTSNNTVLPSTIPVGKNPVGIAITPDGKYAYVINGYTGQNSVSVIDIITNTTLPSTITVVKKPGGIAITPDGKYAYVASYNEPKVSKIRVIDNTVADITLVTGDAGPYISITFDSAYFLISDTTNHKLLVGRISDDSSIIVIDLGNSPKNIAITPLFGPFAYSMEYEKAISGTYHYAQINWEIEGVSYKLYRNGILIAELSGEKKSYQDFEVYPNRDYIYTLAVTQKNNEEFSTYGATFAQKYTAKKL